jgi:hypothetical protein
LIRRYDRHLWKCFTGYIHAALSLKSLAHQYNNALYAALDAEDTENRKPPEEGLRRELHKSTLKLESLADQLSKRQVHYDVVTFSSLSGAPAVSNLDNVQTSAKPSFLLGIVKHLDRAPLKNNGVGEKEIGR